MRLLLCAFLTLGVTNTCIAQQPPTLPDPPTLNFNWVPPSGTYSRVSLIRLGAPPQAFAGVTVLADEQVEQATDTTEPESVAFSLASSGAQASAVGVARGGLHLVPSNDYPFVDSDSPLVAGQVYGLCSAKGRTVLVDDGCSTYYEWEEVQAGFSCGGSGNSGFQIDSANVPAGFSELVVVGRVAIDFNAITQTPHGLADTVDCFFTAGPYTIEVQSIGPVAGISNGAVQIETQYNGDTVYVENADGFTGFTRSYLLVAPVTLVTQLPLGAFVNGGGSVNADGAVYYRQEANHGGCVSMSVYVGSNVTIPTLPGVYDGISGQSLWMQ